MIGDDSLTQVMFEKLAMLKFKFEKITFRLNAKIEFHKIKPF